MAVRKIPYRAMSGVAKDDLTNVTTGYPIRQNKVRNGCFRINQRAKTGTVTLAAGEYGHDGWKGGASGCTYTFATSNEVVTLTISSGSLVQVIEGNDLETGTHTMSWTGTAQGKIGAGSLSASGVTGSVTGGSNLSIEFGTGTLAKVKLEKGAFATAFEMAPVGDELRRCQRYYEKSYDYGVAPGTNTTTGAVYAAGAVYGTTTVDPGTYIRFSVRKMSSSPTMKFYQVSGTADMWEWGPAAAMQTKAPTAVVGDSGFHVYASALTGLTNGQAVAVRGHWICTSEP